MWLGTTVWNGIALEHMLHKDRDLSLGIVAPRTMPGTWCEGEKRGGRAGERQGLCPCRVQDKVGTCYLYICLQVFKSGRQGLSFAHTLRPIVKGYIKATGLAQEMQVGLNQMPMHSDGCCCCQQGESTTVRCSVSQAVATPLVVASPPGLLSPAGESAFSDTSSPLALCLTWKSSHVPRKSFMMRKGESNNSSLLLPSSSSPISP